jgi:hypothetical protein
MIPAKASPNGRLKVVHSGPDPRDKIPPQNLEAERSVLGSILLEPATLPEIIAILGSGDFYRDAHQVIFEAMVELHERGIPADSVSVPDELIRRDQFAKIGGDETLKEIVESVPHAANAKFYAGIVREKSIARQVVEAASLMLPDRLCLRSVLRGPRSLEVKRPWPAADQARWTVSKESALWLRNEAAGIPEKK